MKNNRLIIALAMILTLSSFEATAQNEIYKKYSSVPGITKVYISKAMFSLMSGSAGNGGSMDFSTNKSNINVSEYSKKLTGLYILSTDNAKVGKNMLADFLAMAKGQKLELLMDVEDDGDLVKMYSIKKGGINTDFFLTSQDSDGEIMVMHLEGNLTDEDVASIMKSAKD